MTYDSKTFNIVNRNKVHSDKKTTMSVKRVVLFFLSIIYTKFINVT